MSNRNYKDSRGIPKPASYGFHDMMEWQETVNEAAVSPNELPEDVIVKVSFRPKHHGIIVLADKHLVPFKSGDPIHGEMWFSYEPECGGHMIQWVRTSKGFGPLIYDIALELVTSAGSWLVGDRNVVSDDATKVWEYYDQKRNDVEKKPIDMEADCSFRSAIKATKYHQLAASQRSLKPLYMDWEEHPLAHRWRKPQMDVIPVLKSKKQYHTFNNTLKEEISKFDGKYKQVFFEMSVEEDEFVHFTTAKRASEIIESKKLLTNSPYKKFGQDSVTAVSLTYGEFVPNIQTTHIPIDEGQVVAIKFKTNTAPQIGFVDEVSWQQDVYLIDPKIITANSAINMIKETPENKRLNKHDWGFVKYVRGGK